MKKILSICAILLVALVFTFLSRTTEANKTVFSNGSQDDIARVKQISLDYLRNETANRAIGSADTFDVLSVSFDDLKMAHTKVRQTVSGVPVWEGEAIVHIKADGSLSTITDDLKDAVSVTTAPNFSAKEAVEFAKLMYDGSKHLTEEPTADLFIYRGKDRDHLAYRVQLRREDGTAQTALPVIFVDAQTGENVFQYDNLQTATGSSLYSGTVNITTSSAGSTFYMEDTTRRMGTFNMNNTGDTTTGTGGTQSRYTDTNDVWDSTTQRAGVDAHLGAAATYDYYQTVHGRNGINGSSGPGTTTAAANSGISLLVSRVHFGVSYNNAFWNGSVMTYGDGDGSSFSPLVTTDIAGHEMTHGVTQFTANLTYSNESGALNEAVSDIFGAMVERNSRGGVVSSDTWKIGEQAYTPATSGDALRYMDNPTRGNQPDNYANRLITTADSGGVHTNSGIANYEFYLLSQGGTTSGGISVTGIGATSAERIWYRALTVYMTAGTNFAAARTATTNASNDLFGAGSAQSTAVGQSWCAVGVGACPTTPTPTPTPGGGGQLIVNGAFEGSQTPWVSSGTGVFYIANGSFPHGGTGYIYFGVDNNTAGQAYQQVSIPSTATGNLTFWLNVSSSETTTTTQYDRLFVEVRNTSGTLLATLATYSNLNKAAAGTYTQRGAFSLAAYRGQTVRIQFRTTTDSSVTTTFRVDDVSLQ